MGATAGARARARAEARAREVWGRGRGGSEGRRGPAHRDAGAVGAVVRGAMASSVSAYASGRASSSRRHHARERDGLGGGGGEEGAARGRRSPSTARNGSSPSARRPPTRRGRARGGPPAVVTASRSATRPRYGKGVSCAGAGAGVAAGRGAGRREAARLAVPARRGAGRRLGLDRRVGPGTEQPVESTAPGRPARCVEGSAASAAGARSHPRSWRACASAASLPRRRARGRPPWRRRRRP